MDTPERGILRNAGKNSDEEANLGAAVKEQQGLQSEESSRRDGKAYTRNNADSSLYCIQLVNLT